MIRTTTIAFATLALIGCGGGGGGGGGGAESPVGIPPVVVTLDSVSITPADPSIAIGETVTLQAFAHFSDGSTLNASVSWHSADPALATVTPSGVASGVAPGSVQVTATSTVNASITGHVTVQVKPPPVIYAHDTNRGILRYAKSGGIPVILPFSSPSLTIDVIEGMCWSNGYLYLVRSGTPAQLHRMDPVTGAVTWVHTYPASPAVSFGLAVDSQGRMYTNGVVDLGESQIYRYDPVSNTSAVFATIPLIAGSLQCDAADNVVGTSMIGDGCFRLTQGGGFTMAINVGMYGTGYAIESATSIYSADPIYTRIFRSTDANGDGDFLDAAEGVEAYTFPSTSSMPWGLHWTGDALIMNDYYGSVYLLKDLDGDGIFSGAAEVTTWAVEGISSNYDSHIFVEVQP